MTQWTKRDDLLMAMLGCGLYDLSLIDDVNYDNCDVLEQCGTTAPSFRDYIVAAFELGIRDIEQARDDRLCELEAITDVRDLDPEEEQEKAALEELSPAADIGWYFNYLDTHVYFTDNEDVYQTFLPDALDKFCYYTGFEIES